MNFIIQLIIGLVLSVASTLIKSTQEQDKQPVAGVRGTIQTGGDSPLAFIMGFYGTSGTLNTPATGAMTARRRTPTIPRWSPSPTFR